MVAIWTSSEGSAPGGPAQDSVADYANVVAGSGPVEVGAAGGEVQDGDGPGCVGGVESLGAWVVAATLTDGADSAPPETVETV